MVYTIKLHFAYIIKLHFYTIKLHSYAIYILSYTTTFHIIEPVVLCRKSTFNYQIEIYAETMAAGSLKP